MLFDISRRQNASASALVSLLALLVMFGTGCSKQESEAPGEAASMQAPATPVAPEATPPAAESEAAVPAAATEAAAPAPVEEPTGMAAADGQKTYETYCVACHAAGVAGAPKLGDREAWAPRIAKGNDALLNSAKNGLNAMPPRGTCMACSDEDLGAAIAYMVGKGS